MNTVSETITNRIIPIVSLSDSIEGFEEFLTRFKSNQTKITSEVEQELTKKLIEAGKNRDKSIPMTARELLEFIKQVEEESKNQDRKR